MGSKEDRNKQWFGAWAKTYDSSWKNPLHFYLRHLQKKTVARIQANPKTILDVGCGTGRALEDLSKKFPSAELYGVDLTPEMLVMAKKRLPRVRFIQGSVLNLPFKENMFDYVISTEAFHHYSDQIKALQEMKRVCKIGGHVIVTDPEFFFRFAHYIFEKLEPGCVRVNTKKEMKTLFENVGLSVMYQGRLMLFAILTEGVNVRTL